MALSFEDFANSAEAFSELFNEFVDDHPTELRLSGSRHAELILTMRKIVGNLPNAVRNTAFELTPVPPAPLIPEGEDDDEA